jgi:hypothetical protein
MPRTPVWPIGPRYRPTPGRLRSVRRELRKTLNLRRARGETSEELTFRFLEALIKCPDSTWAALPEPVQRWGNEAIQYLDNNPDQLVPPPRWQLPKYRKKVGEGR